MALTFILLTVCLDAIGIGLIFPVMPDLMVEVTGLSLSEAALWGGAITASFAIMQFLFGPVVGNLSDRFGRRPILLIGLSAFVAASVGSALAGSMEQLIAWRAVQGAALGPPSCARGPSCATCTRRQRALVSCRAG